MINFIAFHSKFNIHNSKLRLAALWFIADWLMEFHIHSINTLNNISLINDYSLLDNLLWLFGKIKDGSFSLMFPKDVYLQLVNLSGANNLRRNVDQAIRNYLQININDHQVSKLLGVDFVSFFNFCFNNNAI